jgi:hypothetical protein
MAEDWTWIDLAIEESSVNAEAAWHEEFARVPDGPGVYLWRLRFGVGLEQGFGMARFLEELNAELRKPSGHIEPSALAPSVLLRGLQIGGGTLTVEKSDFLLKNYGTSAARANLSKFVASLDRFSPVVYVGKSKALRERLAQHVRGETELRSYIFDALQRDWRSVAVSALPLPPSHLGNIEVSNQLVVALEMIAQLALAPHGVRRQG